MADEMTPSARVIKKANEIKSTKDSIGRIIKYKKLKPSDQIDLVVVIGSERSMNPIALSMASAAYRVTEIDGEIIFPPDNWKEMKALLDQLDDEGLSCMYKVDSPVEEKKEEVPEPKKVKE